MSQRARFILASVFFLSSTRLAIAIDVDGALGQDLPGCGPSASPCLTIQYGIGAAADGDTVLVHPGTYNECVSTAGKRITLLADAFEQTGDRASTVIDGSGVCDGSQGLYAPAVFVGNGSEIRGFTVRGGGASGVVGAGGVVITHNVITGNSAVSGDAQRGGGIQGLTTLSYTDSAPLRVEYNDVTDNEAFYWGGGVFIDSQNDATHRRDVSVKGNTIRNNRTTATSTADHNSGGGGLWVHTLSGSGGESHVVVTQNTIEGNSSPTAANAYGTVGGGMFVGSYAAEGTDTVEITNNLIRSNVASQFGGGVALFTYTTGFGSIALQGNIVEANTVVDATGVSNQVFGGGIFAETAGSGRETIQVEENQVRGNHSGTLAGGIAAWSFPFGSSDQNVTLRGNSIEANAADAGGGVDLFVSQTDNVGGLGQVLLNDNDITSNHAAGPLFGTGGGIESLAESIRSATQSSIDIMGNRIQDNTATVTGGGAWLGLFASGRPNTPPPPDAGHTVATTTFKNNLVTGNQAAAVPGQLPAIGGGVVASFEAGGDAVANLDVNFATIANNSDDTGVGGIEIEVFTDHEDPVGQTGPNGEAVLRVRNSILSNNAGIEIGGPEPGVGTVGTGNLTQSIDFNDIFGTHDPWLVLGPDGIAADPLLDAQFVPDPCSPTIDAADPAEDYFEEPAPNGGRANQGHLGGTSAAVSAGACEETCNGIDDNHDGSIDEGPGGAPLSEICYDGPAGTEGVGVCHAGVSTCAGGAFGPCSGEVTPSAEVENGLDDDCDGAVDEDLNPGGSGDFFFSTASLQFLSGVTVQDGDVLRLPASGGPASTFASIPATLGVDGLDVESDGTVLFSVRNPGGLHHAGGFLAVRVENVYALDPATGEVEIVVDWRALNIDMPDLDALARLHDGSIAFSTSALRGVRHAGGFIVLRPQNVYRFDPATRTITLLYDLAVLGLRDLDGFDVDTDGRAVISTATDQFVHGVRLKQQNAYAIESDGTPSLVFDGESEGLRSLDDFSVGR